MDYILVSAGLLLMVMFAHLIYNVYQTLNQTPKFNFQPGDLYLKYQLLVNNQPTIPEYIIRHKLQDKFVKKPYLYYRIISIVNNQVLVESLFTPESDSISLITFSRSSFAEHLTQFADKIDVPEICSRN